MNCITVPLTLSKVAIIDAQDADRVLAHKWTALRGRSGKWYARRNDRGKNVYLHRLILDAPPGIEVDHKNGDGLDCRRENMRLATRAQNTRNRKKPEGKNRFKGAHFQYGKWVVRCKANGRSFYGGRHETDVEAAIAYDRLASRLHGDFARLNFPGEGR